MTFENAEKYSLEFGVIMQKRHNAIIIRFKNRLQFLYEKYNFWGEGGDLDKLNLIHSMEFLL